MGYGSWHLSQRGANLDCPGVTRQRRGKSCKIVESSVMVGGGCGWWWWWLGVVVVVVVVVGGGGGGLSEC